MSVKSNELPGFISASNATSSSWFSSFSSNAVDGQKDVTDLHAGPIGRGVRVHLAHGRALPVLVIHVHADQPRSLQLRRHVVQAALRLVLALVAALLTFPFAREQGSRGDEPQRQRAENDPCQVLLIPYLRDCRFASQTFKRKPEPHVSRFSELEVRAANASARAANDAV